MEDGRGFTKDILEQAPKSLCQEVRKAVIGKLLGLILKKKNFSLTP